MGFAMIVLHQQNWRALFNPKNCHFVIVLSPSSEDHPCRMRTFCFIYKVDELDGIWPLEQHGLLEGTALGEIIVFIKDYESDFSE